MARGWKRPGPPPGPQGNRRTATRVALPASRRPGGRGAAIAIAIPCRHLGSWQRPLAPSWSRAACLWPLVFGIRCCSGTASQVPRVASNFPDPQALDGVPTEASGPLSSRAGWGASFRGPKGPEASSSERPEFPALPLFPYLR